MRKPRPAGIQSSWRREAPVNKQRLLSPQAWAQRVAQLLAWGLCDIHLLSARGPVLIYSGNPGWQSSRAPPDRMLGTAETTRLIAPPCAADSRLPVAIWSGQINYKLSNLPSCCRDTTSMSVYKQIKLLTANWNGTKNIQLIQKYVSLTHTWKKVTQSVWHYTWALSRAIPVPWPQILSPLLMRTLQVHNVPRELDGLMPTATDTTGWARKRRQVIKTINPPVEI